MSSTGEVGKRQGERDESRSGSLTILIELSITELSESLLQSLHVGIEFLFVLYCGPMVRPIFCPVLWSYGPPESTSIVGLLKWCS